MLEIGCTSRNFSTKSVSPRRPLTESAPESHPLDAPDAAQMDSGLISEENKTRRIQKVGTFCICVLVCISLAEH